MTKNELKFLCESQVAQIETWAEWKRERPHGKFYEACKSVLELLDENKLLVETLNECSRKRGKWINKSRTSGCGIRFVASECTCCGKKTFFDCDQLVYNYCPNCGAYMREVGE
jgi:hypothetical protein